ncbi:MAG: BPL-N domain-containing protein [Syntrophobacteraceae bacterium]
MTKNPSSAGPRKGWDGPPVGIFWDQSLVWGLLCVETLGRMGIPFRLLGTSDICGGRLDDLRILLVPGGWAAHKVRALGETGKRRIAAFLDAGGAYIGFCGGAGMALSSPPALHLAPIARMPLAERLPSASGRINVCGSLSHPAWEDIPPEIPVSVWWPSQFRWDAADCRSVRALALYSDPEPDFQVADLRLCDMDPNVSWPDMEKAYGINLDPARIKGHPAIIETQRGRGRMVLSYAHLETPGDDRGNQLLCNVLAYLEAQSKEAGKDAAEKFPPPDPVAPLEARDWEAVFRAGEAAADLISFGEANLLWNWRKPWLLNWRRGTRGLEYGTLLVTLAHMTGLKDRLHGGATRGGTQHKCSEKLREKVGGETLGSGCTPHDRAAKLEKDTIEFCSLAKRLLLEEKIATQTGIVSKLGKVNEQVDTLRSALFGNKMNHGGLCRALFDLIDGMLLDLLRL